MVKPMWPPVEQHAPSSCCGSPVRPLFEKRWSWWPPGRVNVQIGIVCDQCNARVDLGPAPPRNPNNCRCTIIPIEPTRKEWTTALDPRVGNPARRKPDPILAGWVDSPDYADTMTRTASQRINTGALGEAMALVWNAEFKPDHVLTPAGEYIRTENGAEFRPWVEGDKPEKWLTGLYDERRRAALGGGQKPIGISRHGDLFYQDELDEFGALIETDTRATLFHDPDLAYEVRQLKNEISEAFGQSWVGQSTLWMAKKIGAAILWIEDKTGWKAKS